MKRTYFTTLGSKGDTIVEVLVVLAILGLALSISYATASRGLQQARNAQEHSEALSLLDSQVEQLRDYVSSGTSPQASSFAGSFCMSNSGTSVIIVTSSSPSCQNVNGLYTEKITYNPAAAGYYDFVVTWQGLGSLGNQQEEITYRIY